MINMLKNDRKEIGWFLIAGAIVNLTDFSIYCFLFHFIPFSVAKGISFMGAGIVGYFLNKYWTFKHAGSSHAQAAGRYMLINFLALGVNVSTNQGILNVWPHAILGAVITASLITGFLTFICFKWWVFRLMLSTHQTRRQ
jgi:putative flippase GtrA